MLLTLLSCAMVIAVAAGAWLAVHDALGVMRLSVEERRLGLAHLAVVAAVTLFALRLRWQVTPHHVMYLDEPWYIEAAQAILRWGKPLLCEQQWDRLACVPYPKAVGWPLMLAGTFAVTGANDLAAIHLASVLGAATVPVAAMCTRGLGGTRMQSVFAAALVAVYPTHILWSATAETSVAGAFFVLLALLGLVRADRDGSPAAILLAGSALCAASAIRPETALMFLPAAVTVSALRRRARPIWWRVAGFGFMVAAVVALIAIVPMWRLNVGIAHGNGFLSPARIAGSVRVLPSSVLAYHLLLVALALCAFVVRGTPVAVAILAAGLGQILVALSFHQFADRLLISGAIALVPLAAMFPGLWLDSAKRWSPAELSAPAISLAAICWLAVLAVRSAESVNLPESQVLETRVPSLVEASVQTADALVVTEMPAVVAHTSLAPVMATHTALSKGASALAALAEARPIYFVCDMYCEAGFGGAMAEPACGSALRDLELEPVAATALHGRRYGVYRVRGLRKSDVPVRACP